MRTLRTLDPSRSANSQICPDPDGVHMMSYFTEEIGVKKQNEAIGRYNTRNILTVQNQLFVVRNDCRRDAQEVLELARTQQLSVLQDDELIDVPLAPSEGLYQAVLRDSSLGSALQDREGHRLYGFALNQDMMNVAERYGMHFGMTLDDSERANNKAYCLDLLARNGVPTTEGEAVLLWEQLPVVIRSYLQRYDKVAVKTPRGASSWGLFTISDDDDLDMLIQNESFSESFHRPYTHLPAAYGNILGARVEGWAGTKRESPGEVLASPALNVSIQGENDVILLGEPTRQILDEDSSHMGNRSMRRDEFAEQGIETAALVQELQTVGYNAALALSRSGFRGVCGVDFVVVQKGHGNYEALVVEVNGRVTGQTHGLLLQHDLQAPAMTVGNVDVPEGTTMHEFLSHLEGQHLAYTPDTHTGVLVCNSAMRYKGRMQVVCLAGTPERACEMYDMAQMHSPSHSDTIHSSASHHVKTAHAH